MSLEKAVEQNTQAIYDLIDAMANKPVKRALNPPVSGVMPADDPLATPGPSTLTWPPQAVDDPTVSRAEDEPPAQAVAKPKKAPKASAEPMSPQELQQIFVKYMTKNNPAAGRALLKRYAVDRLGDVPAGVRSAFAAECV